MEVCTDKYAAPRYEIMDWCVEAALTGAFFLQLFVELIICGFLFVLTMRIFRWYNGRKQPKEPLNTGKDKCEVWPPL